ncbi:MAG TPA: FAD-dependent oxidoreductase [Gaiellaceae bacterium]|nr:FAD-dependent oxidoreductase [Gaiellaceae bacterium]
MDESERPSRVDRTAFLAAAGAVVAGGALGVPVATAARSPSRKVRTWNRTADVVVVGSGGAAYAAAVTAQSRRASVIMLEKASQAGGTTGKSGGMWWVPNNSLMRAAGLSDPREDAIRYMVRCSYPTLYDPNAARFGVPEWEYSLIAAYYDSASVATDALARLGALQATVQIGLVFPDYYAHLPEDKAPYGRGLFPKAPDGTPGQGAELIRQMKAAADRRRIPLLLNHRVTRVLTNAKGQVIGVEAASRGRTIAVRARKAVVFGSGGFTHNRQMALNYLRGPIFGGCAVPTNTGDFVEIGLELGAEFANMNNAWWGEVPIEQALESSSTPSLVFSVPGDSMIHVSRYGRRVVDEKSQYNERAQDHFFWDPVRGEYPNLVLFMIYDQRTADAFAGNYPLPARGASAPYVIAGASLDELTRNIEARLQQLSGRGSVASRVLANLRLDPAFAANLRETIARYNGFAETGKDLDFNRGEAPIDVFFHAFANSPKHDKPNPTMYPISSSGPYYCILLGAGTLDTKGGPKVNARAQVLDTKGRPIPGLYGAGNCIGGPAGQAYWSGGGTIGPALTFGYLAGVNAPKESVKSE